MKMTRIDDIKFFSRMNEGQGEKRSLSTRIMESSPGVQIEEAYVEIRGTVYYILRWDCLEGLDGQDRIYDVMELDGQGYSKYLIKDNLNENEFESWFLSSQLPVL